MTIPPPPTDLFYRESSDDPLVLPATPRVIVPNAPGTTWVMAPRDAGSTGYSCAHANPSRNGRVPFALTRGAWRVRAPLDIDGDRRVNLLLDGGDRLVTRTDGSWTLVTLDGVTVARGACAPGDLVVDPASGHFLYVGSSGGVEARSLVDGARRHVTGVYCGSDFDHPMLQLRRGRLLALGIERQRNEHNTRRANQCVFESIELGDPVRIDADGWSLPGETLRLFRDTTRMLCAWSGDVLLAMTDDRLYRLTRALDVMAVHAEGFTPLALSADESGRAWAITRTAQGTLLVAVSPAGEVVFWSPIELGGSEARPPIVSHAHRAFVPLEDGVLVVSRDGLSPWRKPIEGAVVGATVTADDHLLVSFRNELVFYDDEGRIAERIGFPRAVLTTAPVLTARGDIVVGGVGVIHRVSVD